MAIYGTLADSVSGSIKEFDLSAISSSIADTAVDIFVYDTSKDSDGGAWRKRTQHTSWYNETLNTAYRGSRREFPAVAVIVTIARELLIYDGDDPDLPLWMRFVMGKDNNKGKLLGYEGTTEPVKCTYALNGIIATGEGFSVLAPFHTINFVSDSAYGYNTYTANYTSYPQHTGKWITGIGNRNTGGGYVGDSSSVVPTIVNVEINDIAMTVLPNAPIDETTGLPKPTIAVGTDGGVTIIKDNWTSINITASNNYHITNNVSFDGEKLIWSWDAYTTLQRFVHVLNRIPDGNLTFSDGVLKGPADAYYGNYSLADLHLIGDDHSITKQVNYDIGLTNNPNRSEKDHGIVRIYDTDSSPERALFAHITKNYNTGWMHGDIKGAFLSDTDATNVTGSELVTNGTFDTNSDWVLEDGTVTISSGTLNFSSSGDNIDAYQIITTEIGKTYVASFEVTSYTAGQARLYARDSGGTFLPGFGFRSSTGVVSHTFTAIGTSTRVIAYAYSGPSTYSIDNFTTRLADPDRSVNNKGLQVYGTITKSPVAGSGATAAELVGYSGFSNSNYLLQPYNSDMDFTDSDFYITFWGKTTDFTTDNQYIIYRSSHLANTTPKLEVFVHSTGFGMYINDADGFNGAFTVGNENWPSGEWALITMVRRGGSLDIFVNGEFVGNGSIPDGAVGSESSGILQIGWRSTNSDYYYRGSLALLRIGAGEISRGQIRKMYHDEKQLFKEGASCTIYGSSDVVTALTHDDSTDTLHVGTSSGRSDFQGLRRINNTTTAVTTAMSASNGLIAEQ